MEKSKKDRIKTIAIIFLAILLVLTFFSNTIMNWSLPQVKGSYTEYGTIKTGVRGTGIVESNLVYNQTVKGDREITDIFFRNGDRVEKGDVIMKFTTAANTEYEAKVEELNAMKDELDTVLLQNSKYNKYYYAKRDIDRFNEDNAELFAKKSIYTDEYVKEAKKKSEEAEKAKKEKEKILEKESEIIEDLTNLSYSSTSDSSVITLIKKVNLTKDQADYSKRDLDRAEERLSKYTESDLSSYSAAVNSAKSTLTSLENSLSHLNEDYADDIDLYKDYNSAKKTYETKKSAYEANLSKYGEEDSRTAEARTAMENAGAAFDTVSAEYTPRADTVKAHVREIEAKELEVNDAQKALSEARERYSSANSDNKTYRNLESAKESAEKIYDEAKEEYDNALKAVENAKKSAEDRKKTAEREIKSLEDIIEEYTEIKTDVDTIKAKERELEDLNIALESSKNEDLINDKLISAKQKAINKLQNEIAAKYGSTEIGGSNELTAKYSGTVCDMNYRIGDTIMDGQNALSIESDEMGYTLSFSVSNTDAMKLKEGDTATVTGGWWGSELTATLSSIKTEQGGKTKTLTFDINGDVEAGQSLTLMAGEKSTSYNAVIPKSAIHEDKDGKYVYITKAKNTPLGNRYVVTKLAVNVVASDDVNSAISTDDAWLYEYVITSSTKPFAEGEYVRLAD